MSGWMLALGVLGGVGWAVAVVLWVRLGEARQDVRIHRAQIHHLLRLEADRLVARTRPPWATHGTFRLNVDFDEARRQLAEDVGSLRRDLRDGLRATAHPTDREEP